MASHRSFESDLDTITRYSEVPASFEDDLYYADLERQILELTADDDDHDEEDGQSKPVNIISPSRRASNEAPCFTQADFPRLENYGNKNVMARWFGRLDQIKSNGTGVFIPHVIKSRTISSSGRMSNNHRRRLYRQTTKNSNQRVYTVV